MPKFNWVLSTLLVTAMMISGLPTKSAQTTEAQTNPSKSGEKVQQNDNDGGLVAASTSRSWQEVFQDFFNNQQDDNDSPGPAGDGIARGGICGIAPLAMTSSTETASTEVWSDRPLFVWRGLDVGKQIEVRLPGNQEVLWHQEVPVGRGMRRVVYGGKKPLQPGQTYNWVVINQANQEFEFSNLNYVKSVTFKVMDAQKRDRIKADLTRLEEELKNQRATPEEIALQRANYFAQRQLWSDVLQEVYSVKNPSAALEEVVETIPNEICTPRPSSPNAVLSH